MLPAPRVNPAANYDDALERARAYMARDDASIRPEAYSKLLSHGERRPSCVVLLHGFTNHPGQYAQFAPLLHERGSNVFVPRLPEHGDKDRMTHRIERLTAEALVDAASEAVDIACGLGERVCVAGISSSGVLCAYFAQHRADVWRAVGIAPVFSIMQLPYWLSYAAERAALVLPNAFLWWDPRVRERQQPLTAYPQFPTRALAQTLRISDAVYAAAKKSAPAGGSAVMLCNAHDPAVNNDVTAHVVKRWNRHRAGFAQQVTLDTLPGNHDIIDPDNPRARTDIVYPALLGLIYTA